MDQLNKASLEEIVQALMQWLEEKGYSASMLKRYRRISNILETFMKNEGISYYTKEVGKHFLIFCKTQKVSAEARKNAELFTERMDCLLAGLEPLELLTPKEKFPLPDELKMLLDNYQADGIKKGLKEISIRMNLLQARYFLFQLSRNGCTGISRIDVETIGKAVRSMGSASYIPRTKTFLRFLATNGHTLKDYSYIVPNYRIPHPLPSVYSEEEILEIEKTVPLNNPEGKRDFAAFLLAARLGLRSGDISSLTFAALDFKTGSICITQQKTGNPLELPLLPEISEAIIAYINEERPPSDSPYIFLASRAPYRRMSAKALGKRVAKAIKRSQVDPGNRRQGTHALRSSMASSMVNDDVPYEVVKEILGHSDPNSTRHYARLDAEKLRPYALTPPEATGIFREILMGRRSLG